LATRLLDGSAGGRAAEDLAVDLGGGPVRAAGGVMSTIGAAEATRRSRQRLAEVEVVVLDTAQLPPSPVSAVSLRPLDPPPRVRPAPACCSTRPRTSVGRRPSGSRVTSCPERWPTANRPGCELVATRLPLYVRDRLVDELGAQPRCRARRGPSSAARRLRPQGVNVGHSSSNLIRSTRPSPCPPCSAPAEGSREGQRQYRQGPAEITSGTRSPQPSSHRGLPGSVKPYPWSKMAHRPACPTSPLPG
jgi:hypothetical protein